MTAVITDFIKRDLLNRIINSVDGVDSDSFYLAIGRTEQWNDSDVATTPVNHTYDERNFRLSMQSMKNISDISFVVPRNNWTSGTLYSAFDDKSASHPAVPYFVVTDENNVYVCIERALNANGTTKTSTVKPTGQATTHLSTSDGYTWQFLYTIPTSKSVKFLSSNYMPVQLVDSDDAVASVPDAIQKTVQDAAVDGEILNAIITAGGSGYTSAPTVVFDGNGSGAAATATVTSGVVTKIAMTANGSGYDYCQVSLTGGGGSSAAVRAVIGQQGGLGTDPVVDLKAKALMFNSKIDGLENDDFIVNNEFRQIALVKNPLNPAGNRYGASTGLCLKKVILTTTGDTSTFSLDQTFTGGVSGNQALIDYIDSDTIFFHQNLTTGFGGFDSDVAGLITAPGASGTVSSIVDSADIDNLSGTLLYLENRGAITRDTNQTEDIKVIIQI